MQDLKTLKACGDILISHPKMIKDVSLFSLQIRLIKHHLTETHRQNFEIHNILLSSQSVSLSLMHNPIPRPISKTLESLVEQCSAILIGWLFVA